MSAANRFCERHGYALIPDYGEYVDCAYTVSYERIIGLSRHVNLD
jgi:hypothetical protein